MPEYFSPADRLAARYGAPVDFTPPTWNETLDVQLRHRSVRQWLPRDVDESTLRTIVAAAQSAPSSSNKQVVSVIAVRDTAAKEGLAAIGRQMSAHIINAPVTLVWLIDFSHGRLLAEREQLRVDEQAATQGMEGTSSVSAPGTGEHNVPSSPPTDLGALNYLDEPMMAALDIGIAAQNAVIAAASLGLGTVYLGSLRNDIDAVREILDIPETVVPFVGLELGFPDPAENADVKPRLPMELFLHEGCYHRREGVEGRREHVRLLDSYDDALASYFSRYGEHPSWSSQLLGRLSSAATEKSNRRLLRRIMEKAGFGLR
jgi:nitroreductase